MGATAWTLVLFALAWALGPPILLWLVTATTCVLGRRVRRGVHAATLGALAGIFLAQTLTQSLTWSRPVIWILSMGAVVGATACWLRFVNARRFLGYLAVAPALFVGVFLLTTPVVDILRGSDAAGTASQVTTPVVFVILDELPTASLLDGDGDIDPAVFPGFSRLASISTWYRNATTVSSTTERAIPAILSGRRPTPEPVAPVASQFPQNLFTLFGADATSQIVEPVTRLCPEYLCATRAGGLRAMVRPSIDLWRHRFRRTAPGVYAMNEDTVNDRVGQLDSFIEHAGETPAPRLDFIHSLLPHVPWRLLPSGRAYDEGTDNAISPYNYAWVTGEAARVGRERHLLQLQYTDRRIGDLLDRLEDLGTLDETLLVVTADHGVSFDGAQPLRASTPKNLVELAWVPLFVKAPGQPAGRVDDRNAESIDILPTVADLLDVRLDEPVDGRSLLRRPRPSATKYMLPTDQTTLPTDTDGQIVIDGARGFRQLLAMPAAASGTDPLAPVRSGRHASLVGRLARDLPVGDPVSGSAVLDDAEPIYSKDGGLVPTMARATIRSPDATEVALLVNGAVAGTYRLGDDRRARFVVAESLWREGPNDVEVMMIDGPRGSAVLRPFAGA